MMMMTLMEDIFGDYHLCILYDVVGRDISDRCAISDTVTMKVSGKVGC